MSNINIGSLLDYMLGSVEYDSPESAMAYLEEILASGHQWHCVHDLASLRAILQGKASIGGRINTARALINAERKVCWQQSKIRRENLHAVAAIGTPLEYQKQPVFSMGALLATFRISYAHGLTTYIALRRSDSALTNS